MSFGDLILNTLYSLLQILKKWDWMAGEGGVHTIEKNDILHMEKETVTIVLAGNDEQRYET